MERKLQKYVLANRDKCVGCKACELACFAEHNSKKNGVGKTVGTVNIPVSPKLYVTKVENYVMPIQCRHCEDAPCLNACSVHAITRRDGVVYIDQERCTGCKDCIMACPFGAIEMREVFLHGKVVMQADGTEVRKAASKCDLCLDNPKGPACVRNCPNDALRVICPEENVEDKRIRAAQALALTKS